MRRDLPAGTVTFLFTDVEGSTKLLRELGADAYAQRLAEHRRVVRDACTARSGVEVDTQGDAFFVAFPTPREALDAARSITEELAAGPITLRIGLHTGTPLLTEEGYVGEDVHFAARVAASAHGGQVVVSQATRALIDEHYPLVELGEHRLKDIPEPVAIYQLGDGQFPPLKTISNTNLPRPASSFVGREWELQELLARIEDGARLVTLTGPGGSGKTRLALEAAATLVPEYKAGVFWVGLASLRDPALVSETIAQTLGAKDGLAEHIGDREMLLLLDNLEQVIEAAPELASLVSSCPNLALVVTSRELLRVQGEIEYPVPPLAEAEAVSLFCERAQTAAGEEVAELCRRLDNLPLAVELAAARTKALTPAQILERLSQRLDLLKGGRDADPRQQTLRATIEWSYDLLRPEEQRLFARLSVFAGGCTLEAVAAICEAELDTLTSLVDKSLIRPTEDGRFLMLETIREYAATLLGDAADAELRDRHSAYYRRWLEQFDTVELRCSNAVWSVLERDHPNLQAALEWAHIRRDDETALAICCALAPFWMGHSHLLEGAGRLDRALQSARAPADLRLAALDGRAILANALGEFDREEEIAVEQRALSEQEGDIAARARALCNLALAYVGYGDFERAAEFIAESLDLARDSGDEWVIAVSLLNAGALELGREHYQEAVPLLEEARRHAHASGASALFDPPLVFNLGLARLHMGAPDEAAEFFRESISLALEVGSREYVARGLNGFGAAALARNEPRLAAKLLGAGTAAQETLGFVWEPTEQAFWEKTAAAAAAALGQQEFTEAWAEGASLSNNQAAVWALSLD